MIIEKLAAVQAALKAPKSQRNNFGNYNYRSCEDILEAVKPLLVKQGLALTISDEITAVGERIYVKATATLFDGQETMTVSAYAREEESKKGMDASQVTGAASSYARKYALNGLFCIDDTKDADATNTHGKEETETKKEPAKAVMPVKCSDCGNTILPYISDGKKYTSEQIIKSTLKKFGEPLCWDCAMKANEN